MEKRDKVTYIGKYQILEKIGEGGFGIVYRGHDPLLDRLVAIKVLKSEAATSQEFIERFKREARLAASLRHPNIVNVIEVGEQEGRYFLVMDLLSGGPLSDLLKDGRPIPINQVIDLLKPVADALDYAHRKGMIHRDVKPSNIILDEDRHPVLTDFGLGKSLSDTDSSTTGVTLGTAEYMAPEQILGNPPGPATDIYALGVIAFQMLTGKVPFSGTTPFTIQKGHAESKPPDPRSLNPELDEGVSHVLLKVLEKNPVDRYSSGNILIETLAEIVQKREEDNLSFLYKDAEGFIKNNNFPAALEKLTILMKLNPNYKDTFEKEAYVKQKIINIDRYEKLALSISDIQSEANAILESDKNFPDTKMIFQQLGFHDENHGMLMKSEKPRENSIIEKMVSNGNNENQQNVQKTPSNIGGIANFISFQFTDISKLCYLIGGIFTPVNIVINNDNIYQTIAMVFGISIVFAAILFWRKLWPKYLISFLSLAYVCLMISAFNSRFYEVYSIEMSYAFVAWEAFLFFIGFILDFFILPKRKTFGK